MTEESVMLGVAETAAAVLDAEVAAVARGEPISETISVRRPSI